MMEEIDNAAFERIVDEEWNDVPERFRKRIENVALLIEDEPDAKTRAAEGLGEGDTLLGLYTGVPAIERGAEYGVGVTLPDTITLYRLPILEVAAQDHSDEPFLDAVRRVVRETVWHEVGHYFGLSEGAIGEREGEGTNQY
jgi:predicted Zn-dependent protease with MMP-like domain